MKAKKGFKSIPEQKMEKIARKVTKQALKKNIEAKFFDAKLALAGAAVDYNGLLYNAFIDVPSASTIVQGTDDHQYIGAKIRPTGLTLRWAASNDLADANNIVSCVILQGIGAFTPAANMANIYQSTGNVSAPLSPFDEDYNNRFRVLYRKEVALSQTGDNAVVHSVHLSFKKFAPVIFNDGLGAIESQPLMIGWISDSSAVVHPVVRAQWRIHFQDA